MLKNKFVHKKINKNEHDQSLNPFTLDVLDTNQNVYLTQSQINNNNPNNMYQQFPLRFPNKERKSKTVMRSTNVSAFPQKPPLKSGQSKVGRSKVIMANAYGVTLNPNADASSMAPNISNFGNQQLKGT